MSIINVKRKYLSPTWDYQQSGSSCVAYLDSLKPHNTDDLVHERNARITTNCGRFAVVLRQRDRLLEHANKPKDAVDLFSIVQSFSADELDYRSSDDIDKAHQIGIETAKMLNKRFGIEREWAVYTQADGDGHCIHNHIVYMNYDRDLVALKELSWKRTLLPINESVSDKYLTTEKQKAVRQRTLQTAEEIIGSPLSVQVYRHKESFIQSKQHIEDTVKSAVMKAKSETQFKMMLLRQGVRIQQRNADDDAEIEVGKGLEAAWRTKSGRYRKSLAFTYHGVTTRSDKLGWTTEDIVEQIRKNTAGSGRLPRRQDGQRVSQPERKKLTKKLTKKAPRVTAKKQQTKYVLSASPVKALNRYQLLDIKRAQVEAIQSRLINEKLTELQRDQLMLKMNQTQAVVLKLQSEISVYLTQREIKRREEELERG